MTPNEFATAYVDKLNAALAEYQKNAIVMQTQIELQQKTIEELEAKLAETKDYLIKLEEQIADLTSELNRSKRKIAKQEKAVNGEGSPEMIVEAAVVNQPLQ